MGVRERVWAVAVALATGVGLAAAGPAHATYPGANGKISFDVSVGGRQIWTINPDGTDRELLIHGGETSAWSADGRRIAYSCNSSVNTCTADAAGGDAAVLPNHGLTPQRRPFWSPDRKRLVIDDFVNEGEDGPTGTLWRIDAADGADQIRLADSGSSGSWSQNGLIAFWRFTTDSFPLPSYVALTSSRFPNAVNVLTDSQSDFGPDWSPDGTKIVFYSGREGNPANSELYVMDADGSNETRIEPSFPSTITQETEPAWSPDGRRIAFERYGSNGIADIWVMNPDGSDAQNLTNTPSINERNPAWQPLPPPGYPRPQSATPVRVSLVPAFLPCQAPTHVHGPPLEHVSCAPPVTAPEGFMTFGAAPAGASPKAVGSVRLAALAGAPGGGSDADVRISAKLTDVRRASDLADGKGSLELQVPVRLTERNGVILEHTTVQDFVLKVRVPCAETADPAIGSTCAATTTANALLPSPDDVVREGVRAIWELGQVKIWDGGPGGEIDTPNDNQVLATQGVFIP